MYLSTAGKGLSKFSLRNEVTDLQFLCLWNCPRLDSLLRVIAQVRQFYDTAASVPFMAVSDINLPINPEVSVPHPPPSTENRVVLIRNSEILHWLVFTDIMCWICPYHLCRQINIFMDLLMSTDFSFAIEHSTIYLMIKIASAESIYQNHHLKQPDGHGKHLHAAISNIIHKQNQLLP